MATKKKSKIEYVNIDVKNNTFVFKLTNEKKSRRFTDAKLLKNLFSKEKAKILYILKIKNPKSIYTLAKELKRDFKSVRDDAKVLEKFGLIKFLSEKTGKRKCLRPVLATEKLQITINI